MDSALNLLCLFGYIIRINGLRNNCIIPLWHYMNFIDKDTWEPDRQVRYSTRAQSDQEMVQFATDWRCDVLVSCNSPRIRTECSRASLPFSDPSTLPSGLCAENQHGSVVT